MRSLLASTVFLVLAATMHVAAAQTGNAPFCLKAASGQLRCVYPTIGECEQARSSATSDQCITRSDVGGATGLGDSPVIPSPGLPTGQTRTPER